MGEFSKIYITDLSDRELKAFWKLMQDSGRDKAVTYCMEPTDGKAFCKWMRNVEPWIVLFRGVPVGFYFLTDRRGKTADIHFAMLPVGTARTAERVSVIKAFGLYAASTVLWTRNASGSFYVDTLLGLTPACNRQAVKFVKAIGGEICGVIPKACWYRETNENVDGVVSCFTREKFKEAFCKL